METEAEHHLNRVNENLWLLEALCSIPVTPTKLPSHPVIIYIIDIISCYSCSTVPATLRAHYTMPNVLISFVSL